MSENPYRSPESDPTPDQLSDGPKGSFSWYFMVLFGGCAWLALCSGMLLLMSRQIHSALIAGVVLGGCGAVYAWQRLRR